MELSFTTGANTEANRHIPVQMSSPDPPCGKAVATAANRRSVQIGGASVSRSFNQFEAGSVVAQLVDEVEETHLAPERDAESNAGAPSAAAEIENIPGQARAILCNLYRGLLEQQDKHSEAAGLCAEIKMVLQFPQACELGMLATLIERAKTLLQQIVNEQAQDEQESRAAAQLEEERAWVEELMIVAGKLETLLFEDGFSGTDADVETMVDLVNLATSARDQVNGDAEGRFSVLQLRETVSRIQAMLQPEFIAQSESQAREARDELMRDEMD